jgi:hypothetical protein
MEIINLTPHAITLLDRAVCTPAPGGKFTADPSSTPTRVIAPSGKIARVSATEESVGELEGIPLVRMTFGAPIDLPSPEEGKFFIVSAMVKNACPGRTDLLVPAKQVVASDNPSRMLGCLALAR